LGTPQLQATTAQGDADGDRDVDGADLNGWEDNFGASLHAPSATLSAPVALQSSNASELLADTWWIYASQSIEGQQAARNPSPPMLAPAAPEAKDAALSSTDWQLAEFDDLPPLGRARGAVKLQAIDHVHGGEIRQSELPSVLAEPLLNKRQDFGRL
jgi:hypothetical protein